MAQQEYWKHRISRRRLLGTAGTVGLGLGAAALIGCSGSDDDDPPAGGTSTTGSATATSTSTGSFVTSGNPAHERVLEAFPINPPPRGGTPKAGGVLRLGSTFNLASLDPASSQAGATVTPAGVVYNRLLTFKTGPDFDPFKPEIVPDLAESWENVDPVTYTFQLTPGVKFHNRPPVDGRELTAEDVKYSYERYKSTGVNTALLAEVDSVEVVDDHTLTLTLNGPFPDIVSRVAARYLMITPPELMEGGGGETDAVGTGPMIPNALRPGEIIGFEKNPDYFMGEPLLDGFELLVAQDPEARRSMYRSGQVHHSYGIPGDSVTDAAALLDSVPDLWGIRGEPDLTRAALAFNLEDPRYQDVRVRQALAMALDYDTIGAVVYGTYMFGSHIPWPLVRDEAENASNMGPRFIHNPDEAKKLLAAAGFGDGLTMSPIASQNVPSWTKVDEIMVDQLRSIDVTMEPQFMELNSFNAQWTVGDYPDSVLNGWKAPVVAPSDHFELIYGSSSPSNRYHLVDAALDDLIARQKSTTDEAEQRSLRQEIHQRFLDEVWFIPFPDGYQYYAFNPAVRNVRFSHTQAPVAQFYEWGQQLHKIWLDA